MKLRCLTALTLLTTSGAALAQGEELTPGNPFSLPPLPQESTVPALPALPGNGGTLPALPALPGVAGNEQFDFFQPGFKNDDFGTTPQEEVIVEEAEPVEAEKEEVAKPAPVARRLPVIRYNYKQQYLPERIYAHSYNPDNHHLPTRRTQAGYDAELFRAVSRDDLNGTRAMIEHGGRSLQAVDSAGYTLVDTAVRYRANSVLRYLLAKGAPSQHTGYDVQQARTYRSEAALAAAQQPYFPQ
jgi:hypothetical protein